MNECTSQNVVRARYPSRDNWFIRANRGTSFVTYDCPAATVRVSDSVSETRTESVIKQMNVSQVRSNNPHLDTDSHTNRCQTRPESDGRIESCLNQRKAQVFVLLQS